MDLISFTIWIAWCTANTPLSSSQRESLPWVYGFAPLYYSKSWSKPLLQVPEKMIIDTPFMKTITKNIYGSIQHTLFGTHETHALWLLSPQGNENWDFLSTLRELWIKYPTLLGSHGALAPTKFSRKWKWRPPFNPKKKSYGYDPLTLFGR